LLGLKLRSLARGREGEGVRIELLFGQGALGEEILAGRVYHHRGAAGVDLLAGEAGGVGDDGLVAMRPRLDLSDPGSQAIQGLPARRASYAACRATRARAAGI